MTLTRSDTKHVFQRLRDGLVPTRGLDAFAVRIDRQRAEIRRLLELVGTDGEGVAKFLRGGYGCGKTFTAQLATLDARDQGFVTSFVVVSPTETKFHKFEEVYHKIVTELSTGTCPRGALADILDRWIGRVEDALAEAGLDEDADGFDQQVRARIAEDLESMTRGAVPGDFVRVVQTIFDLKQRGELPGAGALLSWLSGSTHVAQGAKKLAGVKGDIGSRDALGYLRGILEISKAAGYRGLVIVVDEAETILRMRSDTRAKSLNGIRQIVDASQDYPGLLWVFTGTPEFFDTRKGVAGLQPLHDRIRFMQSGGFASLRQAQLELRPFDKASLRDVAFRLRELYPAADRGRMDGEISATFIDKLVDEVTAGFKGDVGVVPRQFLRTLLHHMDLVDEDPEYDPMAAAGFEPAGLTPEEEAAQRGGGGIGKAGAGAGTGDDDDELVPVEDAW